jgi:hypothetical protein
MAPLYGVKIFCHFLKRQRLCARAPARQTTGGFILSGVEYVNWVKESFLSNQREKRESHSFGN